MNKILTRHHQVSRAKAQAAVAEVCTTCVAPLLVVSVASAEVTAPAEGHRAVTASRRVPLDRLLPGESTPSSGDSSERTATHRAQHPPQAVRLVRSVRKYEAREGFRLRCVGFVELANTPGHWRSSLLALKRIVRCRAEGRTEYS